MPARSGQHQLHLLIGGIVQGVGFRFFVERTARRLGLRGWVRNLADGRVEVLAEGSRQALELLLAECHRGPSGAMVREVHAEWREATGAMQDFEIRPTAAKAEQR
ncbi:MAG: acylphosphatase [Candidatus Binatia bacterium]|nr:MAG: acylphosphatase [Candidatus Binatia bacterium]